MNPRQRRGLLVTVIGVVAALLAVVTVANYTARISEQVGPRAGVYRVARDVPAYAAITRADLRRDELPRKYLTSAAVTSLDQLTGMVSATALTKGALLQSDNLAPAPNAVPQERVIALQVDIEAGVAGSVGPNDRVDVIAATAGSGTRKPVASTVVSGARVLRAEPVGTSTDTADGASAATIKDSPAGQTQGYSSFVVTLAVTPEQAEKIILADTTADAVRLALIPPSTNEPAAPEPLTLTEPEATP